MIQLENVTHRYRGPQGGDVLALDEVNLTIAEEKFVALKGPSGCGKSTLLMIAGGLLRPTSGQVFIDGTNISALDESKLPMVRARSVGFIFQAFNLLDALTVEENILFPARLIRGGQKEAAIRAADLIERLKLLVFTSWV